MNTRSICKAGGKLGSGAWLSLPLLCLAGSLEAQTFTTLDLNAPSSVVTVNPDSSISVVAGGGDTYGTADSFTYLYEQRSGDFDVKVQVQDVTVDNASEQDSAKASLHLRANLTAGSPDIQVSATPMAGTNYVETIARTAQGGQTNDPPSNTPEFRYNGGPYPGTYRPASGSLIPVWLRMKRTGNLIQTFCSQDNLKWVVLAEYTVDPAAFPDTLYLGLASVAHIDSNENPANRVHNRFANYQNVVNPPVPNSNGTPVVAGNAPGVYPVNSVTAVNWQVSLPADGIGRSSDNSQSGQIVWNSGGFGTISRDVLVSIDGQQGPVPFSIGRYATGAFDFAMGPRDPVAAQQNLGPYSNPNRSRDTPQVTAPASQAWFPSPRYGVLIPTARVNGPIQWADGAAPFLPHVYEAIDFSSANYFGMDDGSFGNGVYYTRMSKLGNTAAHPNPAANSAGGFQRAAFDTSVAWFPYAQGWMSGAFANADTDGKAYWRNPASHSPSATSGTYSFDTNSAAALLQWNDPGGLASLKLPDVDAANGGMMFLVPNDDGSVRGPQINCAVKTDGSGWDVAIRGVEENKGNPANYIGNSRTEFSFVYVPYDAMNLVGGRIAGSTGGKINSAGAFTVNRSTPGRYEINIPGKTGANGMLILQPVGKLPANTSLVDNVTLTYSYSNGNFVVESREVVPNGAGSFDSFPLRDSDFYFAWVDFANPLAMPSLVLPVLNIERSGDIATLSWGPGGPPCTLEYSMDLESWTPVEGLTENSVTVSISNFGPKAFFRLRLISGGARSITTVR
ncbi:hypothetical protein KBB96_19975 [Luteolibacter ambystomatis]|uniref:F5/8 type C domain-containing protein n=1 Tax=Luteolibacter ambystomatis TaxID=2824561 RepID=A0A975J006_9BACT|nr:hypothetical protein [Luteolibacter ambystomatis]QUE51120.1 hypothetical protein KBB96_19975 [Luteolibacter ambystomatis]